MEKTLRNYQARIASEASEILTKKGFVYLACQVRVGKTLMALEACKLFGAKKVLFITKIKAFSSIENDYKDFNYLGSFDLTIINKESIHKIGNNDFDVIVCDEAHGLFGTYPKPNTFTKTYKKRFLKIPAILLSGTMSPESYSQLFHQFWICNGAPFAHYKNFYQWANEYVNIKLKHLGYAQVKDYSEARKADFYPMIKDYILTFTQAEAGFTTDVQEHVLRVKMKPITYAITERLMKDLVVTNASGGKQIIADTGAKLQQKIHQLFSGTIKFEDGTTQVIDDTKAVFIKEKFKGKKIAIFYNFVAELDMLKQVFKNDLTTDLSEFNAGSKNIALQIVSGREGISLSKADCLIFLNLQFSAVSFWQARDRLTTMDRKENQIFWIFADGGIESSIYKRVLDKKDYTLSVFCNDFKINKNGFNFSNKNKRLS